MNQLVLFALQAVMRSEKLILEIFAYSLWKKNPKATFRKTWNQFIEKNAVLKSPFYHKNLTFM